MPVPALESYTAAQLEQAKCRSSAVSRWLDLIPTSTPLLKARHRAWIESALATLHRTASAEEVTRHWSDAADRLLQAAWRECGLDKLDAVLLALGKLGAQELNLSSDVDLVVVAAPHALDQTLLGLRQFQKKLGAQASGDWGLRIDFDLRPGGRFGPVVATPGQLRDYYWSQGETWERMAWVRARPLCGPKPLIQEIFEATTPFCYRKFLDFGVMEDLKLLRHRIHAANATPPEFLHLKLGRGGIRDIELYIHSLLIIHAGRRPDLRTHSTREAIERLEKAGLLPSSDAQFLLRAYWQLRQWENQVQAADDQQTHLLALDGPSALAPDDVTACLELCRGVDQLVSTLLGPVTNDRSIWPDEPEQQQTWLRERGISDETAREVWPLLLSAVALSGKTERDELARRQFLGRFVDALREHSLDADLGLRTLLDFVRSVRAKASLFSLLLREPRLIRDLANLFSVSPYLGRMLSARPELLDSFLSQRTLVSTGNWDEFLEDLVERRQLSELLAAGQVLNSRDVSRFGQDLSDAADQICQDILTRLKQELGDSTLQVIALGKWGGRELGVRSDLDFILLTESAPNEVDQRIARRLITRLTENHRGGRLYPIDMRLRPSGQAGPLLQSRAQLMEYLSTKAAAWERQSYLRARCQDPSLTLQIRMALFARKFTAEDCAEFAQIRQKLQIPPAKDILDLKNQVGGLIAIEFSVQIAILLKSITSSPADTLGMLAALARQDPDWREPSIRLQKIYAQLRLYEQLQQLTSFHSGSKLELKSQEFGRLARLTRLSEADLEQSIQAHMDEASQILAKLDPFADGG